MTSEQEEEYVRQILRAARRNESAWQRALKLGAQAVREFIFVYLPQIWEDIKDFFTDLWDTICDFFS